MFARAEAARYEAKHRGRNRVVVMNDTLRATSANSLAIRCL